MKNKHCRNGAYHTKYAKNEHSYKQDNGKFYKYYELQKVYDVQKLDKPDDGPTRLEMKNRNVAKRQLKRVV